MRNDSASTDISPPLELWGGIEASVNRNGDDYYDQIRLSGHYTRDDDISRLAETGIKALRYPVLWEHHAGEPVDWSWSERRLSALRVHGIKIIAGLVHHGSGPRTTSLLDSGFATGLAEHARNVARRFPWIEHYTPINEPLTTARFSCLYGYWYPHLKDPLSFVRALFIQTNATKAAMREVRKINPAAKLVQTEDMGKVYSTPILAYQADFENQRRWLSLDLLCGKLNPDHPLWSYLQWVGVNADELKPFLDDVCPPDIIGINHYVTSDRFLDERVDKYPSQTHGGNGRHQYSDVAAVRVSAQPVVGVSGALKEAWERYQIPLAITECHLGCTREEQLRWIMECWRSAQQLRSTSVDVRALTIWSLFGAYDWDSLLTQKRGHYEPGAYDLRSPKPRATAIVKCMKSISQDGDFDHPVVATEGWWRRPSRLTSEAVEPHTHENALHQKFPSQQHIDPTKARPLLITGGSGTLAQAFGRLCNLRGLPHHILTRGELDICDQASVRRKIEQLRPWAIINCAGYVRVDQAERESESCFQQNTFGAVQLATLCSSAKIQLLTFTSDLVFDGAKGKPYTESDEVAPLNVYGRSKAEAERGVLGIMPQALVVRTSAFFGPWDDYNFITVSLRRLRKNQPVIVANDALVSPTYVPDLVHASLDLLIDGETGIWHLANKGAVTWAQWARHAASIAGENQDLIVEKSQSEIGAAACVPSYSVLGSERGQLLGPVEEALCRYFHDKP